MEPMNVEQMLADTNLAETIDEEVFTAVDGYEKRPYENDQIIYITNKSIGNLDEQITVKGEANSKYLLFERDRYMDGIDLKEKLLQIHYQRADGVGDNSPAVNVEASDQHIRFGWIIPQKATQVNGILQIMPFYYGETDKGETYIMEELYAQYTVHDAPGISEGFEEPYADEWYTQFLDNIEKLNTYTDEAGKSAKAAKQSEINAGTSAGEAKSAASEAAGSAGAASGSATAAKESETKAGQYLSEVEEIRESINEEVVIAAQKEIQEKYIPQIKEYTSQAANSSTQATESASNAQKYEQATQEYLEQTRQLSMTNVGNITFFINADRNCLSAMYDE